MIEDIPRTIGFDELDSRYRLLRAWGMREPAYGGPLSRHLGSGDRRMRKLRYDSSPAAIRLWNFLLTEEDRLHAARAQGKKIVGVMKDLGTAAVMAYSLPDVVAFYPDGAWWLPCIMEMSAGLLRIADSLGIDESFCPVRAMLGAFLNKAHFPLPDLLICSVGATCDDFSAIAQRLSGLGHPILWWEVPHRRRPDATEAGVRLPGGFVAPSGQVEFVAGELSRVRAALEDLAGQELDDRRLAEGIRLANRSRRLLRDLRRTVFTARAAPMPALEMLIAEMLAIHYCSDSAEAPVVLGDLLEEARRRADAGAGVLDPEAVRVFWVNPVADLRAMNLLEDSGGRVCGTDYLFCHAIDEIAEDVEPMEALARMALADPMVGSAADRASRICADIRDFGSEAVVVSAIPGASHCAMEGTVIAEYIRSRMVLPVVEMEVPPLTDSMQPTLRTRLEALVEIAKERRES